MFRALFGLFKALIFLAFLTVFALAGGLWWYADAPLKLGADSVDLTIPAGSSIMFAYPGDHDPCLLIRMRDGKLLAYSQKCTHLSCAVIPEIDEGILRCPCHVGIFDLATGRNMAGPPPRPLPIIELEVTGDDVYAVGVKASTT